MTYSENEIKLRLLKLLRVIREETYYKKATEPKKPIRIDMRWHDVLNGQYVKRMVIELNSRGCEWAIKGGGCTICGLLATTSGGRIISKEDFVSQVSFAFKSNNLKDCQVLNIYNSGSILNPREIPTESLTDICRFIKRKTHIKRLVLESRIEFIERKLLKSIKDCLGDHIELVIATGIESTNDFIRALCLCKGISYENIKSRIKRIKGLARLRIYILLKPPFLTEMEAIIDSIQSIKMIYKDLDFETIHFQTCTVQQDSLVHYMYDSSLYKPPWLWSIISVLQEIETDRSSTAF